MEPQRFQEWAEYHYRDEIESLRASLRFVEAAEGTNDETPLRSTGAPDSGGENGLA